MGMLGDAATADVEVAVHKPPPGGQYEVLFPIFMPEAGTFDWMDWVHAENPSKYIEVSDRAISEWAMKSGIWKAAKLPSGKASNDKPDMSFGIASIDDGSVKDQLMSSAAVQQRNYAVMEIKGNL